MYPKAVAVELAKVANAPVLAIPTEVKLEVAKPAEPEVVATLKQIPVIAVQPTGEEVEIAQEHHRVRRVIDIGVGRLVSRFVGAQRPVGRFRASPADLRHSRRLLKPCT